jgi:hypothetical protein
MTRRKGSALGLAAVAAVGGRRLHDPLRGSLPLLCLASARRTEAYSTIQSGQVLSGMVSGTIGALGYKLVFRQCGLFEIGGELK